MVPSRAERRRSLWWFRERFYWNDAEHCAEDVTALILKRRMREERQLRSARALMQGEADHAPRRDPLPPQVARAVVERDGQRCVQRGPAEELQIDTSGRVDEDRRAMAKRMWLIGVVALVGLFVVAPASAGAAVRRCEARRLALSVARFGTSGAFRDYLEMELRNTGHGACAMRGYPQVGLLNGSGQRQRAVFARAKAVSVPTVTLAHSRHAVFSIRFYGGEPCSRSISVAAVLVSPPNSSMSLAVHRRVDMCAPARITIEPVQAVGQTYVSCGSGSISTSHAPRTCRMSAYDRTQDTMVDIAFRRLNWRSWGTKRATATGQYAVSGAGWNPVSLTASGRTFFGEFAATFYTQLSVVDTCACGFLGPGRGFILD